VWERVGGGAKTCCKVAWWGTNCWLMKKCEERALNLEIISTILKVMNKLFFK
jgi:hypothetical protein